MRLIAAVVLLACSGGVALAQAVPLPENAQLRTETNVVVVPALVSTAGGQPVFTLTAEDFKITDDGVEQKLTLDDETGGEPLALVVVIEVGGAGAREFNKYSSIAPPLAPMLESIVGAVPHQIAVVTFDSEPKIVQGFTANVDAAAEAIRNLQPGCTRQHHLENCAAPDAIHDVALGDNGAAILDALGFSVDLLRAQPKEYRRAILMISETLDRGSHLSFDETLRAVTDSNTLIYSIGFSTGKSEAAHYAARGLPSQPGRAPLENHHPNPPHGCMGKDPDPDPDASLNKMTQAYDCLTQLVPPLALAKMLAIAATDGMKRNVPETVANLTGGEYFRLNDAKNLEGDLMTIANHMPNRYMLSFQPRSPHPGFHSIALRLRDYPEVRITARKSYWADEAQP